MITDQMRWQYRSTKGVVEVHRRRNPTSTLHEYCSMFHTRSSYGLSAYDIAIMYNHVTELRGMNVRLAGRLALWIALRSEKGWAHEDLPSTALSCYSHGRYRGLALIELAADSWLYSLLVSLLTVLNVWSQSWVR